MAVITRYVVVRNGVESDRVFTEKKAAEAYDKMLDAADDLAVLIKTGGLDIGLEDAVIDALSVFLAKNGPAVTRILKGLKPVVIPKPSADESPKADARPAVVKKKAPAVKAKPKTR